MARQPERRAAVLGAFDSLLRTSRRRARRRLVQAQRPLMSSDVESPAAESYRRLARIVQFLCRRRWEQLWRRNPCAHLWTTSPEREARSCA